MAGAQDFYPNIPSGEQMSATQVITLVLLERIGGSISLISVCCLCIAYWLVPEVRNVQNTFIVFASVSNIGASVASIIAMDGMAAGKESTLCKAQSFLFQMFMQSDPWWALAMAINVFLVFFFHASPDGFRRWWWFYCLICYGGPFVIALSLLLVRDEERGPVYGEATLWCWIDREWDDIRIYTYYMLIWICIAGSLLFYFMVGYHVFQSRNNLRSLSTTKSRDAGGHDDGGPKIKLSDNPADNNFYGTVVTEVQVVHSTASSATLPSEPKRAHAAGGGASVTFNDHLHYNRAGDRETSALANHFFSTVTATPRREPKVSPKSSFRRRVRALASKFIVDDPIKRAYLRTSFLFALSVLVTWIPSSMNRIHSWLAGESPFEYHVATAAVLPLQGLWNAVIFFVTSSRAIRNKIRDGLERQGGRRRFVADESPLDGGRGPMRRRSVRDDLEMSNSDEEDVGTLGSDVELRHMTESPAKTSSAFSK